MVDYYEEAVGAIPPEPSILVASDQLLRHLDLLKLLFSQRILRVYFVTEDLGLQVKQTLRLIVLFVSQISGLISVQADGANVVKLISVAKIPSEDAWLSL